MVFWEKKSCPHRETEGRVAGVRSAWGGLAWELEMDLPRTG